MRWAKPKANVDYRDRWPTQLTLIESRASLEKSRVNLRWGFGGQWLNRKSSREPGKSTHPYDTAVEDPRNSLGPNSISVSGGSGGRHILCKLFTRISRASSPPLVRNMFSRWARVIADQCQAAQEPPREPRAEPPKTPIQFLRLWTNSARSSFRRRQTVSPFDFNKEAGRAKPTETSVPPSIAPESFAERRKRLSSKLKSFVESICPWRRRARVGAIWRHASSAGHISKGESTSTPKLRGY
ncbi:hypothetical protein GGR50DRAFT_692579 [Xylaria sp. CBS 124048]|nr:hypothetical protein GGR50DRAFT_692579 [Xylaria sp. CBS 124048]